MFHASNINRMNNQHYNISKIFQAKIYFVGITHLLLWSLTSKVLGQFERELQHNMRVL